MESRYRLIPEEIPAISKATVYNDVMEDFLKRDNPTARVEMDKKKPSTIHQGLLKAKRLGSGNVCHTGARACFFRDLSFGAAMVKGER